MRNCWDQATHQQPSATGVEGAGGTGGPGCGARGRWRGQAAVPVGGGGAWPGFEPTRRAKLAARTARGRAAAHGHTKQPGPAAGPDGARNTSGAARNNNPGTPKGRAPKYPPLVGSLSHYLVEAQAE